jgi:predicted transcriptional regulator
MATVPGLPPMSKREREVMDILYRLGSATVGEIMKNMSDPPGYSGVRSIMRVLLKKDLVQHHAEGVRYVYVPKQAAASVQKKALRHVVKTFFGGSPELAATALLQMSDTVKMEAAIKRLREEIKKQRARDSRN